MLRRVLNDLRYRIRKAKAKLVLLFHTKIRFARISRLFKLSSMSDRFSRYTKDCVVFKTIMYHDKHSAKAMTRWLLPFFQKLVKIAEFSDKVTVQCERLICCQRQARAFLERKKRRVESVRH